MAVKIVVLQTGSSSYAYAKTVLFDRICLREGIDAVVTQDLTEAIKQLQSGARQPRLFITGTLNGQDPAEAILMIRVADPMVICALCTRMRNVEADVDYHIDTEVLSAEKNSLTDIILRFLGRKHPRLKSKYQKKVRRKSNKEPSSPRHTQMEF